MGSGKSRATLSTISLRVDEKAEPRELVLERTVEEAVLGWRLWVPSYSDDGLRSPFTDAYWPPHAPLVAGTDDREVGRGIHAFWSLNDALRATACWGLTNATVIGTVALWGAVVVHQSGLRARIAYPTSFFLKSNDPALPTLEHNCEPYAVATYLCDAQDVEDEAFRQSAAVDALRKTFTRPR